ncbi:hypothetical protein ABPG74_022505 [Tetrahymena malaccensis]
MIPQINPPYLKHIESQGYVFSYIFKSQISSKLRNDNIYQHLNKAITDIENINLYPKEDKIPEPFKYIHKWIFTAGIRPLKPGDEKYTKVNQVLESKDISNASNIQDINYFCIRDPSNNKIYRCVSGIFYEKISTKHPKDKKTITYLVPCSYCVVSEHLFYHPMKQLIQTLVCVHINPNEYYDQMKQQENSGIFIQSVIEDEGKFLDFIIQSVFHISEIKGHNHKFCINLTTDTSHPFLSYYNKNDLSQPFLNLVCPSNISFEHIIFNQSPSNLFHLVICLFLEYQVVITSSKQSTSTLFCENLLTLIKPMNWKGLYYPTQMNSGFDYQQCFQPFLVGIQKKSEDGLERFQKQPKNRVIYDLDENNFISKPEELPIPISYKNYLIKNLNFIIADLRFWEEQSMTIEAEMKYKQYFYNFFLLVFHDVLNYFQKGSPPVSNVSTPTLPPVQDKKTTDKNTKKQYQQSQVSGKSQKSVSNTALPQDDGKQNFISFGQAYFNQEEYIKSFGSQDQHFFQKVCQTQGFQEFVKQCFKSIDFKADYVKEMRILETEYSFHQIFLYINDCRYLAKRQQDQTLNDKIQEIEQMQQKVIQGVVNKQFFPEIQMCISLYCQDYLEGALQIRSFQDIKTTARSQSSNEKQNNYLYAINQNNFLKQQQQQQQTKLIEPQQTLQKDNQLNTLNSFQLTQRQGNDGIDTARSHERNQIFMCDISKIENVQGISANNIDKLDQKYYEQIIKEMNLNVPQSYHDCDRISTNGSYNDYDINENVKHFPNSLQLFNRQSNLEQRNNLENTSYSPEKLLQSKIGENNLLSDRQFLGISNLTGSNANNGFILSHNTYLNTYNQDDITTCSHKAQIANNLSQTKLSPSNSVTQIGQTHHLNFLSNFVESQQQSSQQFNSTQNKSSFQSQNEKSLLLNLQQGCFDLWGHYQEEGNLNVT